MSWTAYLDNIETVEGRITLQVIYTDGVSKKLQQTYQLTTYPSSQWLQDTARTEIQRLEGLDVAKAELQPGLIDTSPIQPIVSDPDQVAFQSALNHWRHMERTLALNLIAADDKLVISAQTELQQTFKPEYIDLI